MKKFLSFLVFFVFSLSIMSASSPISLSLWEDIAYPNDSEIAGLELGIGSGLQELKGIQLNFLLSKTQTGVGAKFALINQSDNFKGLDFGFFNLNTNNFKGLQLGCVNVAKSNISGLQFGFFNYAENADTFLFQLGLVNYLQNSIIYKWFPFVNILF